MLEDIKTRLLTTLRLAHMNSWEWNLKTKELELINVSDAENMGRISPLMAKEVSVVPNYPEILQQKGIIKGNAINMVMEYQQKIYHAKNHERVSFRIPFTTMDGEEIWIHFTGEVLRDAEDRPDHAVGFYRNVTRELEDAKAMSLEDLLELRHEKQHYLTLINGLTAEYTKVFFADIEQDTYLSFRLDDFNETLGKIKLEQISSYRQLMQLYVQQVVYSEDRYLWNCLLHPQEIQEHLKEKNYFNINYRAVQGENLLYCQAKIAGGGADRSNEIVIGIRNVDEEYRRQQDLERQSKLDGLTGILNRRGFEQGMKRELCDETCGAVAFLFIDLDHFKTVNDTFGHSTGDDVLCKVAKILYNVFRKNDLVGRYGGDEFCVLLRDIPLDILIDRLEECLSALHICYQDEHHSVEVTGSIGVAYYTGHTKINEQQLKDMADEALYEAKQQGRDRYVFKKVEFV